MDLYSLALIYLIISASLSLTSYFMLYRPSIKLLEEILETKKSALSGLTGFIVWNIIAAIGAPFTLVYLLRNNNKKTVENLAVSLANQIIDEE